MYALYIGLFIFFSFLLSECLPGVILTPPIRRSLARDDNLCVAKSMNPVLCFTVLLKIFSIHSLVHSWIHHYFLCMSICLHVCMPATSMPRCLWMSICQHVWLCIIGVPGTLVVGDSGFLGTEITDGCESQCGCWELNLDLLQEQPMYALNHVPSLQPPSAFFFFLKILEGS